MNVILKKLRDIQRRPQLYLAEPTLLCLKTFLDGYALREYEQNGDRDCAMLDGLQEYIARKYQEKLAISWASIISRHSASEEEAFSTFFVLLEEYMKGNPPGDG